MCCVRFVLFAIHKHIQMSHHFNFLGTSLGIRITAIYSSSRTYLNLSEILFIVIPRWKCKAQSSPWAWICIGRQENNSGTSTRGGRPLTLKWGMGLGAGRDSSIKDGSDSGFSRCGVTWHHNKPAGINNQLSTDLVRWVVSYCWVKERDVPQTEPH